MFCTVGFAPRMPVPPGYPTPADTGLAGVGLTIDDLTPYTGPVVISTAGTTLYRMSIPDGLDIRADNVTIRECYIGIDGCNGLSNNGSNCVVEDCLMIGRPCGQRAGNAFQGGGYVIRRCDVSQYHDGLKLPRTNTMTDTIIHDLLVEEYSPGQFTHNDCTQSPGGCDYALIDGCTLLARYQQGVSCMLLQSGNGDTHDVTLSDSFLSGGAYMIHIQETSGNQTYNILVSNCVLEEGSGNWGHFNPDHGSGDPEYTIQCTRYHTGELCEFSDPCPGDNLWPTADAGPDQTVRDADDGGDESVTLDGSGSSDSDGTISSYVWYEDTNQIATGSGPSVTLDVGTHQILLAVTDDDDASSFDTVMIDVLPSSFEFVPVADAGADQTVIDTDDNGSQSVSLDGSGSSDQDGTIVSYTWREDGSVIANGETNSVTLAVGYHVITLEVIDNNDNSATDIVNITVQKPGELTSIGGSGWQSQALSSSQSGVFTVEFDAMPHENNMDSGATGICPSAPSVYDDAACIVRFHTGGSIQVRGGDEYTADSTVNYSAGTIYHFVLDIDIPNHQYDVYVTPQGGSQTQIANNYAFRTSQASCTSLAYWGVTATSGSHTVNNVVVIGDANNVAPTANAGSDQNVNAGTDGTASVTLDGTSSSDSDGTISSYVWTEDFAQIATGSQPSVVFDYGVHTIILTVTDNDGATDDDVVIINVNALPVANAGGDQTLTDSDSDGSEVVVLDGSGSYDVDGTISSYSWKEGAVEIATGETNNVTLAVGVHTIDLTVTDDDSATGTDSAVITINAGATNIPPVADAGPDQGVIDTNADGNEVVTLDGTGSSDSDGTISSYVWKEGATQLATGSGPNVTLAVGEHTITLTVTDDDSATDTDDVVITVYSDDSLTSTTAFQNRSFTSQSGTFTANFDMVPHDNLMNGVTGLSDGAASGFMDLACFIRLNETGQIDVRNGKNYEAENIMDYSAGTSYHVRMEVDISNHTYDVFITPAGSAEVNMANDYDFRTQQSSVTSLDNWCVRASGGSHTVSSFDVSTGGADSTAPSPDPMTFATVPYSTGTSSVAMIATTATDISGVEYYFDCTAGGGNDSGWQASSTYEDTGLSDSTTYTYKVRARDMSANQNATSFSTTASATTDDGTAPSPDPMTWSSAPSADSNTAISMTATTATDSSGVEYYFDCVAGSGGSDSGWQASASYTDTGLNGNTEYTYMVRARDKSTAQNATGWSTTASATTNADAGGETEYEFNPVDDSFVKSNYPDNNFGSSTVVMVRNTPYYAYLKFNVTGLSGSVTDAKLRIYCLENSSYTVSVWAVTGSWDEDTITWNNDNLSWGGSSLDSKSSVTSGTWYEFDLGDTVTGNGIYTIGMKSADGTARDWASKESDSDPCLIVTTDYGSGDTDPPTPDPMTFSSAPSAASASSISMTATTATDSSGVQYYFECATAGGNDSGWQSSASYTDTGLSEVTEYTYRVKARDQSANQNETAWSATASATTLDGTAPSPSPLTWSIEPYSTGTSSINMIATTATDVSGVEYYFDCTAGGGSDSGWQDSATYSDTGLDANTTYTYKVRARDKSSSQNATSWSTTASATTDVDVGGEYEFNPVDDSFVKSNYPDNNFGDSTVVMVRGDYTYYAYLKFSVTGMTGSVSSATLRIRCEETSSSAVSVWSVTGSWDEDTITWNNDNLSWGSESLDIISSVTTGTWYEFDVTSAISGNGTFTLGMQSTDASARNWASKESDNDPCLIVVTE